jgi:rhamnulokinase
MDEKVYEKIPLGALYARTGIQKQIFNTIYQLMAVKEKEPEFLQRAKTLLMLPDYFGFRLTGNKLSEYTNGSTTQLVNPNTFQWDTDLIRKLGYPEDIFLPLKMPGTKVGQLLPEIQKEVGFNLEVVLCGSHDTASAVMAVPQTEGDGIYISSGTWSLMGIESLKPIINKDAAAANFTNEGFPAALHGCVQLVKVKQFVFHEKVVGSRHLFEIVQGSPAVIACALALGSLGFPVNHTL